MVKNKDNNFHTLHKLNKKNKTGAIQDNSQALYSLLTANKPIRG